MTTTANIIRFETDDIENSNGTGRLATLTYSYEIVAQVYNSDKDKAPTHKLFVVNRDGDNVEVGAIWKNENTNGGEYFSLNIPQMNLRANLGKAADQDEHCVQAIIPWAAK